MINSVINKKFFAVVIILVIISAFTIQDFVCATEEITNDTDRLADETVGNGDSETVTIDQDEVLVFLRDVVRLDLSKYEIQLSSLFTNYWPMPGGNLRKIRQVLS
jgi:hypothetical protein